jgi:hypothetical protein
MIEVLDTGLVYRNPKPHLRSIHAWHPSIARLDDGELVCAFDLGEAVESLDYATYVSRSADGGRTWAAPSRMFQDVSKRRTTHSVRIRALQDGSLVGLGARFYRDDPEEGLANRANMGLVAMDVILMRSFDRGRSWEGPRVIKPPLVGPSFEICHAILELKDGTWLAPMATWKGWDGQAPNGMKAIALVSRNQGETWPQYLDVFDYYREGTISFEQSMVQLSDGRLLAVVWRYHEPSGGTQPTPYALSDDGQKFSAPRETGLLGQTAKITLLPDGRVFCLYRRNDQPGLWANTSRIEGDRWVNLESAPVWQGAGSGMTGKATGADELGSLKFGFPSMTVLPTGEVFAVFWCCEDSVYNIRWYKIRA